MLLWSGVAIAQPEVFELKLDKQTRIAKQYPAHIVKFHPSEYKVELTLNNRPHYNMEHHLFYNKADASINGGMYFFMDDYAFLDGGVVLEDTLLYPPRKQNMNGRIIFGDTISFEMNPRRKVNHPNYTWKYRMMKNSVITWETKDKYWSISCMGRDAEGYYYFIHSRAPYTVEDLSTQLRDKLGIVDLLYLEGGPESTLASRLKTTMGSYETDFMEDDRVDGLWDTPYAFILKRK